MDVTEALLIRKSGPVYMLNAEGYVVTRDCEVI